jgi:hypothetical protein
MDEPAPVELPHRVGERCAQCGRVMLADDVVAAMRAHLAERVRVREQQQCPVGELVGSKPERISPPPDARTSSSGPPHGVTSTGTPYASASAVTIPA